MLLASAFAQDTLVHLSQMQYRNVGPTRGGRVTAVTGIPSRPHEFYMGSTGGGVWKTTDYGQSWQNVSDGYFHTASIGALRVAPSNPDIIYVGTGSDGLRSNVITGKGVYKSLDAGKSWKHLGLKGVGQIGAVEIDPASPDRVFVAAIGQAFAPNSERGVYRTLDGGETWEKVLYIADTVGVVDLEFAPDNSQVIYAATWRAQRKPWTIISGGENGGIYKSLDGGDTWQQLSMGLPDSLIGKIDLAVSADDPDRLYALIEAPVGEGGLYRSDDRGERFELMSTKKELLDRPFYYCNVDANPQNADVVYINSTQFFRSTTGGNSWQRLRTPHGDNHDVWINPLDTMICIQANDGGANVSRDNMKTWSSQHNQSTAELYQVAVDDQIPYWLYAGQQDNSTIMVPSLPPYNSISGGTGYWQAVGGCETGPVIPKPGNPHIVYANCKGRFGVYNKHTGQEAQYYVGAANMYGHNPKDLTFRFQRVSPIHVSPHDPDIVYHASQYLHKTTDEGVTWEIISPDLTAFTPETQVISGSPITRDITGEEFYSTIYAVEESPVEKGVIWVGANDGPVHITRDGGKNWTDITPADLSPGGRVQCITPSPHQAGKAYLAVYRYLLGDWKPYLYKTTDYGANWQLLTDGKNGIPVDYPTRVIREDPDREGLLYAGTEFGVFISLDDGEKWWAFQQNLPVTPITDIKVHQKDLVISTMGRGFWILDNLSPLQEFDWELTRQTHLFTPRDTYRMRFRGNNAQSVPHYPSPSVTIDYYLSDAADSELILEILDEDGQLVRSFSSDMSSEEDSSTNEPSMATGFMMLGSHTVLDKSEGHHRVYWDMRHTGPWHEKVSRSGQGGPLAAPGAYTIRLKKDDMTREVQFKLLVDPRIAQAGITQEDLSMQEELSLKLVELISDGREAVYELENTVKKLEKKEKAGPNTQKGSEDKLSALKDRLAAVQTPEGRYMKPMLMDQLSYLYYMINAADQRPGNDAYERYEELKTAMQQWQAHTQKEDSK